MKHPYIHIYQIAYDHSVLRGCDTGFEIYQNFSNPRPDWYEYWVIRNFLNSNELADDHYYGFVSPKFHQKTGLTALDCYSYIESNTFDQSPDLVSFSPYFDQAAFFKNIFEQAIPNHPGIEKCFAALFSLFGESRSIDTIMSPAHQIIFCNYFAAKPRVWRIWSEMCELIYREAEKGSSIFGKQLLSYTAHTGPAVQSKVFVIERIMSMILNKNPELQHVAYPNLHMPRCNSIFSRDTKLLINLNALKVAFSITGIGSYSDCFNEMRTHYLS
jgi:hypothetical protein